MKSHCRIVAVALLANLAIGCQNHTSQRIVIPELADADSNRGARLIQSYGCGSCHVVPGIGNATGVVGPPLTQFALRVYVAGMVRNTPDNLMDWLMDPQAIVPGNAMPNLDVTTRDARDMAAYLYALD
jgi:cytochrome c1